MMQTSLDMVRQSGFDLWLAVCAAASIVLASYLVVGGVWNDPKRRLSLALCSVGIAGTLVILVLPPLHSAKVGLVWTFLLLSILSTTFYLNLRGQLTRTRTGVLLGMRLVALAMLVPMLFEPVLRYVTVPSPERPLVFLIDTSGSMSVPDVQNGPTRLQSVWQALRPEVDTIRTHFVPQYYTFDSSTRPLKSPDELAKLQADGKSTDLKQAVAAALAGVHRDDGSVVLITDGIDNTTPDIADQLAAASHPIHTISVGSDRADLSTMVNVAVDSVEAPDDFVINHDNKIRAIIKSTALANRQVDVKLTELDAAGKPTGPVSVQKLVLQPVPQGQPVDLMFKPLTPGLHRVQVKIDPIPGERMTNDNQQEIQGIALDPRIKVLYIEGSLSQEWTATHRALQADANIEFASCLRTEQSAVVYDGTVDGETFRSLPTTLDGWRKFDVVILADLDASYLGPAQEKLIEQFVAAGGGLVMLGGHSSFASGNYGGTAIETALPVTMGDGGHPNDFSKFVARETAEGSTHPILEGLGDWFGVEGKPPVKQLPDVNGNVIVGPAKTGAAVLLVHPGNNEPVLIVERYGKGRSAAFAIDTTYLWYYHLRDLGQASPFNRFWGQLVRWLAGQDVRNRRGGAGIEAMLNKSNYQMGEPVRLRAMARDEHGDATKFASISATLTGADGKPRQYNLRPVDNQPGLYQTTLVAPGQGQFKVEVVGTKDGKELGKVPTEFTVLPPADEMLNVAAKPELLARISGETHGYHYDLGQFSQFIDQLIRTDPSAAGVPKEVSLQMDDYPRLFARLVGGGNWKPTYDLPIQGFLLVGLLIAEWLLRRKWQLP